jgi:hypothetical protein
MKHSQLSTAHTFKIVRYIGVGEEVPPQRKGKTMIRIDGVLMSEDQFRILLDALEHQVEVDDFFEEDGREPTDSAKLLLMFQHIGQMQGLDL